MVSDSLALALSLAKGTAAVESTQFRNALAAASEHRASSRAAAAEAEEEKEDGKVRQISWRIASFSVSAMLSDDAMKKAPKWP